jgi:hypothetical protein
MKVQTDAQFLKSAGISSSDAMNDFHKIQLSRIEEAHATEVAKLKGRLESSNKSYWELSEIAHAKVKAQNRKIDVLGLIVFACGLVIAYLVTGR